MGLLNLHENSDYDSVMGIMRRRWQVTIDDHPVTPIADKHDVHRRLGELAAEALALADLLLQDDL